MITQVLLTILATFSFGIIFNVRSKKIIFSALVGGVSWATYLFCLELSGSVIFSFFISSVALTICSELFARLIKTTVTSFLISGLIPLVPGSGIYYTMYHILEKDTENAISKGAETFFVAVAISFGIVVVSSLIRIFKTGQKNRHSKKIF